MIGKAGLKAGLIGLAVMVVISLVIINVHKTLKEIKRNRTQDSDMYAVLKKSAANVLDNEALGKVLATEIAMFYYGLFRWKQQKQKENQFTGYKENGIVAIFITLVFLVVVETFIVHLFLVKWHPLTAWIIFGLSIYAGVQLLGHTKALLNRFTTIEGNRLILRYGLFGDAELDLGQIKKVAACLREDGWADSPGSDAFDRSPDPKG